MNLTSLSLSKFMIKKGVNVIKSIEELQFMNMPFLENLNLCKAFDKLAANKITNARALNKCAWNSLQNLNLGIYLIYVQIITKCNKSILQDWRFLKRLRKKNLAKNRKRRLKYSAASKILVLLQNWVFWTLNGEPHVNLITFLNNLHWANALKRNIHFKEMGFKTKIGWLNWTFQRTVFPPDDWYLIWTVPPGFFLRILSFYWRNWRIQRRYVNEGTQWYLWYFKTRIMI